MSQKLIKKVLIFLIWKNYLLIQVRKVYCLNNHKIVYIELNKVTKFKIITSKIKIFKIINKTIKLVNLVMVYMG